MPDENEIGLEAKWKDEGFNNMWKKYMTNVDEATRGTEKVAKAMNSSLAPAVEKTGVSFSVAAGNVFKGIVAFVGDTVAKIADTVATIALGVAVAALVVVTLAIVVAVVAAIAIFTALAVVLAGVAIVMKKVVDWMFVGADSAVMVASRVQELNLIAKTLGANMGYTAEQVDGFVEGLRSAGISAMVANQAITTFMRANLDLTKSTELATVAQNAAAIANTDSSTALDSLIYAIETLNIQSLRTYGIVVDSEAAYRTYAAAHDTTTSALTSEMRQQAMLDAVIQEGTKIQGAYNAAMMTGVKQLGTMSGRLIPDLKAAMGAPFQLAFYNVTKGLNNIIEAITKMVSEGGVLYPLLVEIGAVFGLITEPILGFGDALTGVSEPGGPIDNFVQGMLSWVSQAFDWGVNFITNFATGIIDGAANALIAAINYITAIITSWFSPGSPPMIAPDIDEWGLETITAWLEGFTRADYSVLDQIQNPLKAALDFSEAIGAIGEGQAGQMFADISKGIIDILANGGDTTQLFADIMAGAGDLGPELIELTQLELDNAAATQAVADAQEALKTAGENYLRAGQKVNQSMLEYNQMLRSGASKEALAQKLKEIEAAKKAEEIAKQQVITAADNLTAAEAAQQALQEQIALQMQLLQTMIELMNAQLQPAPPEEPVPPGGGGGGGGGGPPPPPGGGGEGLPIPDMGGIEDAIKAAMERIRARINDAWQGILNEWNAHLLSAKVQLVIAFENMRQAIGTWAITTSAKIAGWGVTNLASLGNWVTTSSAKLGTWVTTTSTNFGTWYTTTTGKIGTWVTTTSTNFGTWYTTTTGKIGTWITTTGLKFGTWVSTRNAQLGAWIIKSSADLGGWVAKTGASLGTWATNTGKTFGTWVTNTGKALGTWATDTGKTYGTWITETGAAMGGFYLDLAASWGLFWTGLGNAVDDVFNGPETGILPKLRGFIADMKTIGGELIGGLITGVTEAATGLIAALVKAISDAIKAAKLLLEELHSPSEVFAQIGIDMMKGMEKGITMTADLPSRATESAVAGTVSQAAIPIASSITNYYQPSINIPTTINSQMDSAVFEATVRRIVKTEMRRR